MKKEQRKNIATAIYRTCLYCVRFTGRMPIELKSAVSLLLDTDKSLIKDVLEIINHSVYDNNTDVLSMFEHNFVIKKDTNK